MSEDFLTINGQQFSSRLLIGTAGYPNQQTMLDSVALSGAEIVTVSIRRISLDPYSESMVDVLGDRYRLLPNLEIIGDRETLYPDAVQLLAATEELVRLGFTVLPYCNDDLVTCLKLVDLGAAAVMPLGSPIGSGRGIANPIAIEQIVRRSSVPVILDAGIGTASDATQAMELGCAAVLLNTAVAKADNPRLMARAMRAAVEAGRHAHRAGRIPQKRHAEASSPQLGLIGS